MKRSLCVALLVAFVLGCEKPAPTKPSRPSLDATSSEERKEAARQAGEKFGGTKP